MCRQLLIDMGDQQYGICSDSGHQHETSDSGPMAAAVKRLICRLEDSDVTDTPGQRAALQGRIVA